MSRQQLAVKKAAIKLADSLEKSCDAMNACSSACRDAGMPFKGLDDNRVLLLEYMAEYMCHLRSVHNNEGASQ